MKSRMDRQNDAVSTAASQRVLPEFLLAVLLPLALALTSSVVEPAQAAQLGGMAALGREFFFKFLQQS